jgi:hypothetical protein
VVSCPGCTPSSLKLAWSCLFRSWVDRFVHGLGAVSLQSGSPTKPNSLFMWLSTYSATESSVTEYKSASEVQRLFSLTNTKPSCPHLKAAQLKCWLAHMALHCMLEASQRCMWIHCLSAHLCQCAQSTATGREQPPSVIQHLNIAAVGGWLRFTRTRHTYTMCDWSGQ